MVRRMTESRFRWSALLLVSLLAPAAHADPAVTYAGLKYLEPGTGTFAVRADLAYDLLEELSKGRNQATYAFNLLAAGLARSLGFDLSGRKWMEAAGIDPGVPVVGSLARPDLAGARAANRRLEAAARKHLAKKGGSEASFDPATAAGAAPLSSVRVALTVKDASKLRPFLDALAAGPAGSRYVKLDGRTKDEVAPSLKTALGCASEADAAAIAGALHGRQVYALLRVDRDLWVVLRIKEDRHLLLDLVGSWTQLPQAPDKALAKSLGAVLALPSKPAFDVAKHKLASKVFSDDATVALLLLAKPIRELVELVEEQAALRAAVYLKDVAGYQKGLKSARACTAAFRAAPSGDLALQGIGSKSSLRAKAFWAAPATLTRLLQASAAKQDLIDPVSWQGKAVAFAGTTLALGPLGAGLAKGPFKASLEEFAGKLRECGRIGGSTVLLGGWAGLLGVAHTEAGRTPLFKLLIAHLQNGVVLLRELYSTKNPLFLAHAVFGPKLAHAKLKDELAKLYTDTYGKPQELTVSGHTATLYRYLKAPLVGLSGAATDLKAAGSSLTLSSRPWDLQWLLSQIVGEAPTPLPRTILFFAHVNLGTILTTIAREAGGFDAALAKALAARLDRLGANLSLRDGLLSADLDLSLK